VFGGSAHLRRVEARVLYYRSRSIVEALKSRPSGKMKFGSSAADSRSIVEALVASRNRSIVEAQGPELMHQIEQLGVFT